MRPSGRFEPLPADGGVLDRATGLVWERAPGPAALAWAEAASDAGGAGEGWRLPTLGELTGLAAALTPGHPFEGADPHGVFWSTSESPFTREGRVRGVAFEPAGQFVVVLLERTARARRWRVRTAQPGPGGPPARPSNS
jgi:hypothetical protein